MENTAEGQGKESLESKLNDGGRNFFGNYITDQ